MSPGNFPETLSQQILVGTVNISREIGCNAHARAAPNRSAAQVLFGRTRQLLSSSQVGKRRGLSQPSLEPASSQPSLSQPSLSLVSSQPSLSLVSSQPSL